MFRKTYDSLSMLCHVELLVDAERVCLKTWLEASELEYDTIAENQKTYDEAWKYNYLKSSHMSLTSGGLVEYDENKIEGERSLTIPKQPDHLEWPPEVSGIYHRYLPCGRILGKAYKGEDLLPGVPTDYRDAYKDKLTGKFFVGNSYSWIDLTDPSISTGEKTDGTVWVIGVDNDGYARPAFNATAREVNTKAHPVRSARQYGAPACLFVYQPFADMPLDECSITMKYNKGYGFSTNLDGWTDGTTLKELFKGSGKDKDGKDYNYIGQLNEAFPEFSVTSGGGNIKVDATDEVAFKMVDSDGATIKKDVELFLECTGGYLPKKRVTTKDGIGSFKVKALALDKDDLFKVKIGFKNFTGMTDVEFKVVA